MACRDLEDCERARASLRERIANKSIECRELDLASIESIRKFADGILECKCLIYPFKPEWKFLVLSIGPSVHFPFKGC